MLAAEAVPQITRPVVIILLNVMLLTGCAKQNILPHHTDQARGKAQRTGKVRRCTEQSSTH